MFDKSADILPNFSPSFCRFRDFLKFWPSREIAETEIFNYAWKDIQFCYRSAGSYAMKNSFNFQPSTNVSNQER